MIIRYSNAFINFNNVFSYYQVGKSLQFYGKGDDDYDSFDFASKKEADQAIEKILDAYRWQRVVCDLE